MQRQSSGYLPPPRGIPDPDPLKKQMQQDALYFEKHRNEGRKPLDSESKAYKGIVLPKPGEFPGLRAHNKSRRHHAYWWGPNPLGVGFEKNKYEAKFARIRLDNQLSTPRTVLMKTLGWGGNGIACLVRHEHNTPNGPEQEYFVVKCNINPSHHALEGLRKEKKTQAKYRGALHVTQLKHAEIGRSLPPNHPVNNMMFLEYAARGALDKLFCSLNDAHMNPPAPPRPPPEVIPNRILWLMFQCLAQACVGMEHRPSKDWEVRHRIDANGRLDGKQPFSERVPPEPPVIPPPPGVLRSYDDDWDDEGPTKRGTGFVHFDIDPQNVLVCWKNVGPEFDCHKHFPTLKVSDFGNGIRITARDILGDRVQMAYYRKRAKAAYTAPEQFTEEWDWVQECPIYTHPSLLTAGKYSWKTNLYQFALVMFTAITLYNPEMPPLCEEMEVEDPDYGDTTTAWTYGGALFHPRFDHVCEDLRMLVARCLCDQPRFRPGLRELQRIIREHIDEQVWEGEDSDEALKEWLRAKIDHAPPLRGARVGKHWVDLPPSPIPGMPVFPGLSQHQPRQFQPPIVDSGVLAGIQADLLKDAQANQLPGALPDVPMALQAGFNPGNLLNLPPATLQRLNLVPQAPQGAQPGLQPAVQQPRMFPTFQPTPLPGAQPAVQQPPMFPGFQPWRQPAVPVYQQGLMQNVQPVVQRPSLFQWLQGSGSMQGVEQTIQQPAMFPGLASGPMQSVEQAVQQPAIFPAVQPGPQPPQPLNPVAQPWPQAGQPAPQAGQPAPQAGQQAPQAGPPAPHPFNPLAQPWAFVGAPAPEPGGTPPPPWAAKKAVINRSARKWWIRRRK